MSGAYDQEREERMYRLTVRTLYLVALTLNAFVIYEQVKETPEGQILRTRIQAAKTKIWNKLNEARHFRKTANEVVYEAITIVEGEDNG